MKALIVDDHPLARRGLSTILREGLRSVEIVEADSSAAALVSAHEHRPELVLMDMHMPESLTGPELCAQLRAILPLAPIIVVTAFDRSGQIRDCLRAGANACLLKDTSEVDLVGSVRAVMEGSTVIDQRIAQELAAEFARGGNDGSYRLTSREREVLALLADGLSNRQIASRLVISETTTKGHVSALLAKLDVSSRLEAVAKASKAGLV